MEIELTIGCLLLLVLTFLSTIDASFRLLSDVGLRRLAAEAEGHAGSRYTFLEDILEDRSRFSFTLSAAIQVVLVAFTVLLTYLSLEWFSTNTLTLFIWPWSFVRSFPD